MGLFTGNGFRESQPPHDEKEPTGHTEDTEGDVGVKGPEGNGNPSEEPTDTTERHTEPDEQHLEQDGDIEKEEPTNTPPLWTKIVGNISTGALAVGILMGGFLFYQTTYSNWVNSMEQKALLKELGAHEWEADTIVVDNPKPEKLNIKEGQAWATISIPSIDSTHAIVGGVTKEDLKKGPGFFMDTAHPGEKGNFSLAGHRIGKGAPFNRLDELKACDTITIETEQRIHTYKVLPNGDENVKCLTGEDKKHWEAIGKPQGNHIVIPTDVGVVAPNPFVQSEGEEEITDQENMKLLTLVTCNPEWGNWERLIIHAVHTQTEVKK